MAPVDAYALEQRAARLVSRSIKRESKDAGLELAALGDAPVRVASVAGAFPSGQSPLAERLVEIRRAVEDGADEIDIVLNRGALLAGRLDVVHDEVAASKEACGHAHLKTILETAELGSYEMVRLASVVAMAADLESRAAEKP